VKRLLLFVLFALVLVPAGGASERHPSLAELEGEVMCPVCETTLDQSSSPAAQQIKRVIANRIAAGDTKTEIKDRLVAEYGDAILAAPPR
jgi:cytochrome c-type biogenesis protein CcmH